MSKTRKRMPSYRPWGSTEDGRIEFESLTDETLEGALDVIRKSFFVYESVSKAVDLNSEPGACKELEELCLNAAKDGVSVVAIDTTSNEVVGVCFNKIQVFDSSSEKSYFERFSDNCQYKSSKCLVDFMRNVDSRINLFKHYNVSCILELMFLATHPAYGKRRIGELLVISSLELGKELKHGKNVRTSVTIHDNDELTNVDEKPTLASAIMTSNYSQRIATKLHFDQLMEISYDEFEFNGKKFSEKIDQEHQKCVLVAKRLA
ncbi:arylalkylamine N-acetyltransferase-like 2 isoform X2 [Cataglyphis hispanica]|uniref:arylalkylamine N-acetyltransferase-like 2 isoform X2 n=1 Tax=Cataglyphis hispanica TaxID=1086592 RepID=UPI0021802D7F|nr:arylalkylamine N-acetyltransferase-like 2 isoform X2 [Cataglyphis hispanica]